MKLNVAVLTDFLVGFGGGEMITYLLSKKYGADIYTGYVNWDRVLPGFKQMNVNVIDGIPKIQLIKQEIATRWFTKLNLSSYDAIICLGYYSLYTSVKNHPALWYSYGVSPVLYKDSTEFGDNLFWKFGNWLWKTRIKNFDMFVVKNRVDKIATISEYSRRLRKRYYGRDSTIVYPPMDTKCFYNRPSKDYYMTVDRLEPGKKVDMVIEAFKRMPEKTVFVVGTGGQKPRLEKIAGNAKNIKFWGRASQKELLKLYANCTALISAAYYQDWSLVMVEAMASGKPCIGVNQGAYPEIIKEGRNGTLVDGTVEGIMKGVKKITPEAAARMKSECLKTANRFNMSVFYKNFDSVLRSLTKKNV